MAIEGRKLKALVSVEREVTRSSGRTHKQHFWVRSGDEPGAQPSKQAPPPKFIYPRAKSDAVAPKAISQEMLENAAQGKVANAWLKANNPAIASMTDKIDSTMHTGGPGLRFAMTSDLQDAQGTCDSNGMILLRPEITDAMHDAADKGAVSAAHVDAFRVLGHEALHAVSKRDTDGTFGIEPTGADSSPMRTMEEATTEILAQHYQGDFAETLGGALDESAKEVVNAGQSMIKFARVSAPKERTQEELETYKSIGVQPPEPKATLMLGGVREGLDKSEHKPGEVYVTKVTSYSTYVQQFSRAAAYAEGASPDSHTDEQVHNAAVNWAWEVKATAPRERYEKMAESMLERHGFTSDHPEYQREFPMAVSNLRAWMQNDNSTADLDKIMVRIVGRAYGQEGE